MSKLKNRNKAVALRYNVEEDVAPIVIAAGYGEVAGRIIDTAEKQGIPVFRDDTAVSLLCTLDIGRNIPPELYAVVATIYCQLLETSKELLAEQVHNPKNELKIRRRNRPKAPVEENNGQPAQTK